MKPSFRLRLFSFLFMGGGALLLSACETPDGGRDGAARPTKVVKQSRRGTPAPYYGMNAPGNQFPVSGEGRNSNYQPPIKRYDPNRRAPVAPPEEERSTWRKPAPMTGSGYTY